MLNGRLRSAVMVAGLGLGWMLIAPPAASAQCTFDVYPSSVDDVAAAGASGSLSVGWTHPPLPFDVDPLCGNQWSGVSNNSWISTSTSDTNNFTLYYTVAANPTTMARTGTITVGGHATFTIDQLAAPPCPPSPRVSSTSLSFTSAGGMQTVDVQEAAHCRYPVRDNQTWIGVSPATVAGNGTVTVTVDANTGSSSRSGTVTIGGRRISVRVPPPPCTFQVEYTSREVADDAGQYDVSVTASAATCGWSMTSHAGWLDVRTPNRTGSTHGTYRTGDNIGSPQRVGTMTVAGHTVTITQRGSEPPRPCPDAPAVQPESVSLARAAEQSNQVTLQEAASCRYAVTETLDWIRVSPSTVAGNGVVTLTTETANDIVTARSGTVSIGSTSVDVTQAGTTNSSPVAVNDSATTQTDTPVKIFVLANDTDADNDSLTVAAVVQAPAQGTAVVDTGRQTITYTPPTTDWTGVTTFTYRVTDGRLTAVATVTVAVLGVQVTNRPPIANAGPDQIVTQGATVTLDATGSTDPDGNRLRYAWRQDAGPEVTLSNPAAAMPTFTAPALPGDRRLIFSLSVSDFRLEEASEDTVTVMVIDTVLTGHRDRLIADYSTRKNYGTDACAAWDSLEESAQEVFIWNTHRLHRSGILPDVTGLLAVYGRNGRECGGGEYNRTFMTMTPALQLRFHVIAFGAYSHYPEWRETDDPACTLDVNCPHYPFTRQIETHDGHPRGQINSFGPEDTGILPKLRGPPHDRFLLFDYLTFEMDQDYNRPLIEFHASAPSCTGYGSGGRPLTDLYARNYGDPGWGWEPSACPTSCVTAVEPTLLVVPAVGDNYTTTVTASTTCNWTVHSNEPWITIVQPTSLATGPQQVRFRVTSNSGVGRNGTLRVAGRVVQVWQAGDVFTDDPIRSGSMSIRAVHIRELRTRIDVLRLREGLAAFAWTDRVITPEVTTIKAVHLTELRGALQTAYAAAGLTAPTYTDPAITPEASTIRMVHFEELRAAVVGLEQPVP